MKIKKSQLKELIRQAIREETWWDMLEPDEKDAYIKDHPDSKYAQDHRSGGGDGEKKPKPKMKTDKFGGKFIDKDDDVKKKTSSADIEKKKNISKGDKDKLGKLSKMMGKEKPRSGGVQKAKDLANDPSIDTGPDSRGTDWDATYYGAEDSKEWEDDYKDAEAEGDFNALKQIKWFGEKQGWGDDGEIKDKEPEGDVYDSDDDVGGPAHPNVPKGAKSSKDALTKNILNTDAVNVKPKDVSTLGDQYIKAGNKDLGG